MADLASSAGSPARKKAPRLEAAMAHLAADEFFQADLKTDIVQEALRHWLGLERLPHDVAEAKFNDNYRVLNAFSKVKNLQDICAKEGVTLPLDFLLIKAPRTEPSPPPPATAKPPPPPPPPLPANAGEGEASPRSEQRDSRWLLEHPLLQLDETNVKRWWSAQFLAIAILVALAATTTQAV